MSYLNKELLAFKENTNDVRIWSHGKPFTLFSERDSNMVCPWIVKLPCGDLLVFFSIDGDYPLARTRMLRSVNYSTAWMEEDCHQDYLPVKYPVVLDDGLVRLYGEAVDVKGTEGKEYMYFYCDSTNGGRSFSEIMTGRYTLTELEQPGSTIQKEAYWGVHLDLLVFRRALLEAAGWHMSRAQRGIGNPECFEARLRAPLLGGSQRSSLLLEDGSFLKFESVYIGEEKVVSRNAEMSLVAFVSRDHGVSWQYHSVVASYRADSFPYDGYANVDFLPYWEHGYYESSAVQLADGRVYLVMRSGGGGVPLCHVWSSDGGYTWTPPRPIDQRVCGVAPKLLKLTDGTLALCHGRPGMYVMFDESGTGEHWNVDERFDLTNEEQLTLQNNARPFVNRPDCDLIINHVNAPLETLDWVRPELLNAWYYSWENVDMCEVEPGRILVVYDLQNWVEKRDARHRNAIRGVWIEKR